MGAVSSVLRSAQQIVSNITELRATRGVPGSHVTVQGYYTSNDGGGGTFYWNESSTATDDGGIVISAGGAGRWFRVHDGVMNVRWFGARGDGVTDDTAAFKAARNYVINRWRENPAPAANSNKLSYGRIYVPTGSYRITESETFLPSTYTTRTVGLVWSGETRGSTQIFFDPGTTDAYLFYNNNAILVGRVERMTFQANNNTASFMYSMGNLGAQDWGFTDCAWGGVWKYCVHLRGANNNSELFFNSCNWSGQITTALYSQDSDQFLNYWFNECKFWAQGELCDMEMGGHVKVSNCDFSDYRPSTLTYLFNLRGASHARGVCTFTCTNSRFELKTTNSGVVQCYWPHGNVVFDNCDFGSQAPEAFAPDLVSALFSFVNVMGPAVEWRNCIFMGKHEYRYSSNNYQVVPAIRYVNCTSINNLEPNDFLVMTNNNGSTNPGSVPQIHFEGWRGSATTRPDYPNNDLLATDIEYNWHKTHHATISSKAVSMRMPDGGFPINNGYVGLILPVGALVTSAKLLAASGHTSNGTSIDFGLYIQRAAPILTAGSGAGPHDVTLTAGRMYRVRFSISGRTTGTVKAQFSGGTPVVGTVTFNANRTVNEVLTAATGNTTLEFVSADGFDGTISNVQVVEVIEMVRYSGTYSNGFNVSSAATLLHLVTSKSNATVELIDRKTTGLTDGRGQPFCIVEYYG